MLALFFKVFTIAFQWNHFMLIKFQKFRMHKISTIQLFAPFWTAEVGHSMSNSKKGLKHIPLQRLVTVLLYRWPVQCTVYIYVSESECRKFAHVALFLTTTVGQRMSRKMDYKNLSQRNVTVQCIFLHCNFLCCNFLCCNFLCCILLCCIFLCCILALLGTRSALCQCKWLLLTCSYMFQNQNAEKFYSLCSFLDSRGWSQCEQQKGTQTLLCNTADLFQNQNAEKFYPLCSILDNRGGLYEQQKWAQTLLCKDLWFC